MFDTRVIVGGLPRSGSTLLRFMLDRSDELIAGPETGFFLEPLSHQQARVTRKAARIAAKLDLDADVVAAHIIDGTSTVDAFDRIMRDYAAVVGRQSRGWAEKTPRNCFSYGWLAAENPEDAVFISTVRDGLDVVTSIDDRQGPDGDYYCSVQRYCDAMAAVYGFDSDRHRIVFYEDLVADPAATMRALFEWLGVVYTPSVVMGATEPSATRDLSKVNQPKLAESIQDRWVGRWDDARHADRVNEFFAHPAAARWRQRAGYASVELE